MNQSVVPPKRGRAAVFPDDWTTVGDAFRSPEFFPQELTFRDPQEYNLRLFSSFSFVGESDPEGEAALRRKGIAATPVL